jgi:hypothetical protein
VGFGRFTCGIWKISVAILFALTFFLYFPIILIGTHGSWKTDTNSKRHCAEEIPMAISSISGTVYTSSAESLEIWTKQQVAQLKIFVNQDVPLDEIALRLKRTPAAIKLEAAVLGLNLNTK